MSFDINVIVTGLAAPVAVLLIKTALDFSIAHYVVKYVSWFPTRGIFRDNPHNLSGIWEQTWEAAGSANFEAEKHRHGHTTIKQFGRYCFAEFVAKGKTYHLFAKVKNNYLIGEWYDANDKNAYFGVFELQIVNSSVMNGRYIGHTTRDGKIAEGKWSWTKAM